jgi:hypothetical protein
MPAWNVYLRELVVTCEYLAFLVTIKYRYIWQLQFYLRGFLDPNKIVFSGVLTIVNCGWSNKKLRSGS